MTQAFDDRIVRVSIETDLGFQTFEGLKITASGLKAQFYTLPECQVQIYNLKRELRDYLLTQTSPYRSEVKPKRLILEVGRKSYGTFTLFAGEVLAANPTQPPDIGITFHALTGLAGLSQSYVSSSSEYEPLRNIMQKCIDSYPAISYPAQTSPAQNSNPYDAVAGGIRLDDQSTPQMIGNHHYAGTVTGELRECAKKYGKAIYMDNGNAVMKDVGKPLAGEAVVINKATGMIGVPELIQCQNFIGLPWGVKVRMLLNPAIRLGGAVKVESDINQTASGNYEVLRLAFHVDSRDTLFYYIADCSGYVL